MKKQNKKAASSAPAPRPGPTLLEFWTALKNGASVAEASGGAIAPPPAAPSPPSPAARAPAPDGASSDFGSGSNGGGYGLRLVDPDPASQERIRRIMRELCEKDAKRNAK